MEKKLDINEKGCSIRCRLITGNKAAREFPRVVICTHGFGGSKDKPSTTKFAEKFTAKYKNDAVLCIDWPCHGEDGRKKLELADCDEYLGIVTEYAKRVLGAKDVFNYSVSFGAGVTMRYIVKHGNPFKRIALRSASIKMYDAMLINLDEERLEKLRKGKEVLVGFDRKMKIDRKLLDELKAFDDAHHEYFEFADQMLLIHGTEDAWIPVDMVRKFAEDNVIEFLPVEGADHPFRDPKLMDLAIHSIIEFFAPDAA